MDNRRKNYRHVLWPEVSLTVEATAPRLDKPLFGIAVNLSVGGLAALFEGNTRTLERGDMYNLRLVFPHDKSVLNLVAMVVYRGGTEAMSSYGLEFVPLANAETNEQRENAIWRYLLDEQRRQRREQPAAKKQVG